MTSRLGVHVLGPGTGESIVLELPGGEVGVIDSFASFRSKHPINNFLASKFPNLKELFFVAITHPHADHCFRAEEIIHSYPPKEVWLFRPFPAGQVQEYYRSLQKHGSRDEVETALTLPAGSVADSLLQLHERIREPIHKGKIRYRAFSNGSSFDKGRVQFQFLTPCDLCQYAYAEQLKNANESLLVNCITSSNAGRIPTPDHNLASGSILITFGQTRILLMSDAEAPRWTELLGSSPPDQMRKPVQFLKVAHHGSVNGYLAPLYKMVGDPNQTVAVITPFNRGKVHLPGSHGVNAVRPHVKQLYCTNRSCAEEATGLNWVSPPNIHLPALPLAWSKQIGRSPNLASLLVQDVVTGLSATSATIPCLPTAWITDAQKDRSLWRLIRPKYRIETPSASTVNFHLISAFYDDSGTLQELRLGDETGRLN